METCCQEIPCWLTLPCLSAPEVPLQLVRPHVHPVSQGGFIHAGLTSLWMKTNTLLIVNHIVNPWSQSYFNGPVDRKMLKTVALGSCPSIQMSVWAWWPLPCAWSQLPPLIPSKETLDLETGTFSINVGSWLTLFMWICCWYCFCFSRNCWCCCWMTSWASVLWGKGADWVLFRGRWRGSLWVPLIPGEILSFVAKGDWGCKGTPPKKQNACVCVYWYVNKDALVDTFKRRQEAPSRQLKTGRLGARRHEHQDVTRLMSAQQKHQPAEQLVIPKGPLPAPLYRPGTCNAHSSSPSAKCLALVQQQGSSLQFRVRETSHWITN